MQNFPSSHGIQQPSQPIMINGTCMCCDNLLSYPNTVPAFRCTVCSTITDLIPLKQPNDLWLNLELLNSAFPSNEDSEFDLVALREEFRRLSLQNIDLTEKFLTLLTRPGKRLVTIHDIRFIFIILEYPLPKINQEKEILLLTKVFGLLAFLQNNALHSTVVQWFKSLSLPIFLERVDRCNLIITKLLMSVRNEYPHDWRVKSCSKVMALYFAANNKREEKISLSNFYNISVDYLDIIQDFSDWQKERSNHFAFCQYPFLISLGGKIKILDQDAKRQMGIKFKEAFLRTATRNQLIDPFLTLRIRRDYLIQDSLNQLSAHEVDLKKKLRIEFADEEGVDVGGLTKEWFQLLVRDLFSEKFGMFTFDEDSQLCWFNPASFESHGEFLLVGTIIGLAIYNSTILNVHFPLACYKKLLGGKPNLDDLLILKPQVGKGLKQLLEYSEPDLEDVFCLTFEASYQKFGETVTVPFVPNGHLIPVTHENKIEYVNLYVNYIFNTSVHDQFEAFKSGFYHVCGGNPLSLFRAEEIELMVVGGTDIDLKGLESVTEYEGF
ncbi:putative E3 ubiquitin-protein ligase [Clydaea vesicula]|uniref:HECT-type E3 ubiquitin transferase n=1 Tax=Clydaea vesicula TaxID=447962 RepID=A0AAD5U402_9FUNG|nr:putative E3 ubiquitin-protein ligase [Clydaea vesicula]